MDLCQNCQNFKAQMFCICSKSLMICIYCAKDHKNQPGNHSLIDFEDLDVDYKLHQATQAANRLEEIKSLLLQEGKEITGEIFSVVNNSIRILDDRIKKIAELTQKNSQFPEFKSNLIDLMSTDRLLIFKTLVRDSLRGHFGLDGQDEMPFVYKELKLLREEVQKGNIILEELINKHKTEEIHSKFSEFEGKFEETEEKIAKIQKDITLINNYVINNIEQNLKSDIRTLKSKLEELEKIGEDEIIEYSKRLEPIEKEFLIVLTK